MEGKHSGRDVLSEDLWPQGSRAWYLFQWWREEGWGAAQIVSDRDIY